MQSSNKGERLFSIVLLFLIIAFGVFIRVQNKEALEDVSLLGPDSYRYFRQTRQIVETGNLPRIDIMRNTPSGIDNTTSTTLFPLLLAKTFAAIHTCFPSLKLYQFAIFSPICLISLAALLLYLFTNRLFGKIAALFATLIFVSTPAIIFKSSTGIVDTDSTIILFFLAGLLLYVAAGNAQQMWKRLVYTFLSGTTISFLGLIWNGVGFVITVIVFFNILQLCTKGYNKNDFAQYSSWLLPILVTLLGFTKMYRAQMFSPHVILAVGVPVGFEVIAAIFIGIKSLNFSASRSALFNKVPLGLRISIFFSLLCGIILTITSQSLNWINTLINAIFYPFGKNGIMEFVSELHPITFSMWREGYGLIFLFAIPGLCLLTYARQYENRKSFLLHCTLTVLAILGIAISRFVPLSSLSIPWGTDSLIFTISALILVANILYQFIQHPHPETIKENHKLLLFSWFMPSYILTCSAMRFDLFLAPVFSIFAGYMLSRLLKKYMPQSMNNWHTLIFLAVLLSWQVLICGKDMITFLTVIFSLFHLSLKLPEHLQLIITLFGTAIFFGFIAQCLFYRKQNTVQYSAKKACALIIVCVLTWLSIVGIYRLGPTQTAFIATVRGYPYPDSETRRALNEVKINTPADAVIAANWNLGSAINELARRTTIIDEEQNFSKIREMAKSVFYGKNEDEALQFFKEHRATHLLLLPIDFLQLNLHYFAASGQSEIVDQFMPVTPLKLSNMTDQQLEYLAYHPLQIKINTKYNLKTVKKAVIPFSWKDESFTISSPATIVTHEDKLVKKISVKELSIADRQWYFPSAKINGTIWKPSGIVRDTPLEFMDPNALYISPEARESLTVKLYLGEHSERFRLVYESPISYGPMPVKIWEIQYDEDSYNEK